jgi:hypothetical protein
MSARIITVTVFHDAHNSRIADLPGHFEAECGHLRRHAIRGFEFLHRQLGVLVEILEKPVEVRVIRGDVIIE